MVNEAGIRDFLINNLDIIEPDLKLVKKEFTLKNEFGAGGRIDILAKDKFGMFVIIEIKKSDKAARESVQELCKYIALFKDEYGLAANKCRCILLSTEWHELLVPFSAFSRIVDYQIDGYQLILDEQGIPIAKKDVNLTLEGEEKLIFPLHKIFLFRTVSKRDIVIQKLVDILIELEIINYYILIVNYKGNYQGVIYPHAIYLVCDVFTTSEKKKIQKNMNIRCDFMLLGFLEWDGRTFPTISSVFNNEEPCRVFGNQQLLFQLREEAFYELESILMKKHGLGYSLFEVTIEQNIQPVIRRLALEEDDTIHLLPITDEVGFSLRDFLINNRSYVYNLCDIISYCSHFGSQ